MRPLFALVALTLTIGACDKKEEAPPPTPAADVTAAPVPAAPAPAPAPVVDVASLPVDEQFEADAEKEISADNLTAKLDELEKEIAAP